MGKDRRGWRKLVKKLRRKRKRQQIAHLRLTTEDAQHSCECNGDEDASQTRESDIDENDSVDSTFFLSHLEWEERDHQADLACAMKKAETERMAQIEVEKQRKIREEWETKQEQQRKLKEEKERLEKLATEKQEAEFNEFLSFLSGDIETPPTKYLMPDVVADDDVEVCHYFSRTAACRFYDRCTKSHPRPTLSTAILIPNFFSHFKLEQCVRDEYDTDLGLEYEDNELYKEFIEFYDDIIPEFRKHGTVIQFKVCRNLEPHLRGNVYIQYESIRESVEAFKKFNGRFYNGKQLSLQFIKIDSWRSAICGSFLRKACIKGRTCNYLHVFRNPTKEFVKADHDWKDMQRPSSNHSGVLPDSVLNSSLPNETTSSELVVQKGRNSKHVAATSTRELMEENNRELKSTSHSLPNKLNSAADIEDKRRSKRKNKADKPSKSKSKKSRKSRSQSPSSRKSKKSKKSKKKSKKKKKHERHSLKMTI